MAGYTLKNLREIDDVAPRFGYAPHVEARFARTALECRKTGISHFRIAPGFRMPFGHRHAEQEEIYLLIEGGGRMRLDDEVVDLRTWGPPAGLPRDHARLRGRARGRRDDRLRRPPHRQRGHRDRAGLVE